MTAIIERNYGEEYVSFLFNGHSSDAEIIDILEGSAELWNQVKDIATQVAQELDPDGNHPGLADELATAMANNQEFKDALWDFYKAADEPMSSDPELAQSHEQNLEEKQTTLSDIVGDISADTAGALADIGEGVIDEASRQKARDIAKVWSDGVSAANDNIPDIVRKGYDDVFKRASDWVKMPAWLEGVVAIPEVVNASDPLEEGIVQATSAWGGGTLMVSGTALVLIGGPASIVGGAMILTGLFGSEEAARNFTESVVMPALNAINGALEDLGTLLGELVNAAGDFINEIPAYLEAFKNAVNNAMNDLAAAVQPYIDAASEAAQDAANWFTAVWEATGDAAWMGSPLVIDMDMDGQIELVSLENSQLYWDIDEDGFGEHSGWVAADDGLLAIDLDGSGTINSHAELFGSLTEDGFTALAVYDTNADDVIDANDAQFGNLLVWQDVNQNGISEAGELYTLSDLNIISIDLNASEPTGMTIEGHTISHVSSFTVDDGVSGPQSYDIVDAWFNFDNTNSTYQDDYTLDLASLFVTTQRGYGNLPDMHIAASLDNDISNPDSLMSLLTAFSSKDITELFSEGYPILDAVTDIMFRWAGVDGVDPASRGAAVDARKLEFLEELTGQPFLQWGTTANPALLAGEELMRAFDLALYPVAAHLVAQAAGAAIFNDGAYYNPATDTLVGVTGLDQDTLDFLVTLSQDGQVITDKVAFWVSVVNTIENTVGVSNLEAVDSAALEAALVASDNTLTTQLVLDKLAKNIAVNVSWTEAGDVLTGTNGDDVYTGTVGDDNYSATYGNDTVTGGIGHDTLYGGAGDDILSGQLGDDYLSGDGNDDTYLFSLGHGDDTIYDNNGADKIVFGEGVTLSDLTFTRMGTYDLSITIDPTVGAGSITIQNIFSGAVVETLEFSDGSSFDINSLDHTHTGTADDDALYGVAAGVGGTGVDTIYGLEGDDTIAGYAISGARSYTAENHLHGGLGNDTIYGDRGDDAYYFNYGDGDDLYSDYLGHDKIVFGAGVTQDMVKLTKVSSANIRVDIDAGLGGSITLQNHLSASYAFETLEFSDGSAFDISSYGLHSYGTTGNDYLYGTTGADILHGLAGNDTFYGSTGDDTYHLGLGSDNVDDLNGGDDTYVYTGGMDDIYERYGANDTLILDVDATINDITITGGTHSQLVIDPGVNEIHLTYFNLNSDYVIENIIFQDGFSTSLSDFASWYYGTDSADVLTGSAGDDTIIGKAGNDTLSGLAGGDDMHGGAGDDVLSGGDGLDHLWGGLGADTFAFEGVNAFNDTDVIGDFNLSQGDVIDISDLLTGYDPLNDAITDFVQITDDGTNSTLAVDADGGADNFVNVATLYNATGLTDEESLETSGNLIAA